LQGSYNLNTGRVCFTKKYRAGTGDPHENLGHSVEYRGTFQGSLAAGLRGSWFVNTHRYTGEGEFHLWPELWEVQASTPLAIAVAVPVEPDGGGGGGEVRNVSRSGPC
jgi:hypothetical protein